MSRYLLDTNHVSAMLKGQPRILQNITAEPASGSLNVSIISIAELWFMVFNSARLQANRSDLERLLLQLNAIYFAEAEAEEFGRIKAELRNAGRIIPDPDIQIAAVARVNDLTVLTADAHFGNVANLKIENWLT